MNHMAHDGQDIGIATPVILPDLLKLTAGAIAPVETVFATAKTLVRDAVTVDGRVSGAQVEAHQTATHGLAWLATYVESLRQMQKWAEALEADGKFGEIEQLPLQITFGEYLWQLYGGIQMNQAEIVRLQDLGLSQDDMRALVSSDVMTLTQFGNRQAARPRPGALLQDQQAHAMCGASGPSREPGRIRVLVRPLGAEKGAP